ncbi:uncharacterized protein LOC124720134 isoform X2 [Schistocerca piceifrons]|uniref:uncharacterized protein LOC124720134 isoform X2 n=1 Tax=Schistocerca piceifrons TaxID=274613 RepID=UPI001F5F4EA3|nr:uncharacterized protein LOC124720134 isoform X2 [Schistocerca piceifrons]
MDSTKAVLDAILEAESDCCPPPSLVPREDVESMESEVQNDMKPVFALLVPLTPSEEPMVSSMGCAYDNIRLTENTGGSCGISFEESVNQGEVIDELGIGAEGSPHVSMCGSLTQGLLSQEDDSFSTRYNCSLEVCDMTHCLTEKMKLSSSQNEEGGIVTSKPSQYLRVRVLIAAFTTMK